MLLVLDIFFPNVLRWESKIIDLRLSSFLIWTLKAINIHLSLALDASHEFWYGVSSFSFIAKYFLISLLISSLTYCLFSSMLFNFPIFVSFKFFSVGNFIPLYAETIMFLISILLSLLRLFYHLAYGLSWRMFHKHKHLKSSVVLSLLWMSFKSSWSIVLFKSYLTLFICTWYFG